MNYKAVIFDMDGTLLDTLADIADSVNAVIGSYGYLPKGIGEIQKYVGNGAVRLLEQCVPYKPEDARFTQILEQYKQHYLKNCLNKTRPYPQIIETLHSLRQSGIRLGIVSNKPDDTVKRLTSLFFAEYISVALGELPYVKRKPAPDMIFMVLGELDTAPQDALYVGDSEVDILTARNAGVRCVSVTWGFRDADTLKAAGADCMINDPPELFGLISAADAGS